MNADDRREQQQFVWTLVLTTIATGVVIEGLVALLPETQRHSLLVRSLTVWPLAVLIAYLAARGVGRLARRVDEQAAVAAAARAQVARLQTTNSLLHQLASSTNVTTLFTVLSERIGDLIPCDRAAIALTDTGHEFQLFVGKGVVVNRANRDADPPQVHHFLRDGTLIAEVADSGTPRVVANLGALTARHLDANVLASSGFASAVILPLVSEGVALGVLMAVSRKEAAFSDREIDALRPIADIVAVAFATQSLARALGRSQMAKDMADVMFSLANEINGALQAIIGHCELLAREYPEAALQRDLAMVSRQATRAVEVLAQIHGLAEARLQRASTVANLLEDARLEEVAAPAAPAKLDDLLPR